MSTTRLIAAACLMTLAACASPIQRTETDPTAPPPDAAACEPIDPPAEFATGIDIPYDPARSNGKVEVTGAVARPGVYRITDRHGMPTVAELLRIAGENESWCLTPKIMSRWAVPLIRKIDRRPRQWVLDLHTVRLGKNPIGLNDGDRIAVLPIAAPAQ